MSFPVLIVVYGAVLAVEVFANATHDVRLQLFSKPLLMPLLIVYYAANARRLGSARWPILAALFCSWLGDVLLLADKTRGSLFVYGLTAFLAAHLFYIFYFFRMRRINRVDESPNVFALFGVAIYAFVFFFFLAPHVGELLVPVAVYSAALALMLAASVTAFDLGKNDFGRLCAAGTVLFAVSDSVLAINRFVAPFEGASALVMLTYGLAQFLIAEGSLRNLRALHKNLESRANV